MLTVIRFPPLMLELAARVERGEEEFAFIPPIYSILPNHGATTFAEGAQGALSKINGEKFVKSIQGFLGHSVAASLVAEQRMLKVER